MLLTGDERKELLRLARIAISEHLRERKISVEEFSVKGNLSNQCGVFVTLRINGQLRGCIGYAESEHPLAETVIDSAVKAATQDPRFIPLSPEELDNTVIEISVLSPLAALEDYQTVIIGEHGLYLESEHHRGLLLPQVAVENKWDRETFLLQLGKKAGIHDFHLDYPGAKIFTFTADVFNDMTIGEKV